MVQQASRPVHEQATSSMNSQSHNSHIPDSQSSRSALEWRSATRIVRNHRLLVVYGCLLVVTVSLGEKCTPGWFGENCTYICHCDGKAQCDSNGDCPGICAGGWFGPQCQYSDVAFAPGSLLTDNNDETCIIAGFRVKKLKLTSRVNFTWMRLVVNQPDKADTLTDVHFKLTNQALTPLSNITRTKVSDKILDIHASLPGIIEEVVLLVANDADMEYFCSVYVSGGRNIALKQSTVQSSTLVKSPSRDAVDGDRTTCSMTDRAPVNSWKMTLSPPAFVQRYVIYNRKLPRTLWCRLENFHLRSVNPQSPQIHTDHTGPSIKYDVEMKPPMVVTEVNISVNKDFWPGQKVDCNFDGENETYLVLCEVEVYGDPVCHEGRWGGHCENTCKHCKDKKCFQTTGMCLFGCAPGYHGLLCVKDDEVLDNILIPLIVLGVVVAVVGAAVIGCSMRKQESKTAPENEEKHSAAPSAEHKDSETPGNEGTNPDDPGPTDDQTPDGPIDDQKPTDTGDDQDVHTSPDDHKEGLPEDQ